MGEKLTKPTIFFFIICFFDVIFYNEKGRRPNLKSHKYYYTMYNELLCNKYVYFRNIETMLNK